MMMMMRNAFARKSSSFAASKYKDESICVSLIIATVGFTWMVVIIEPVVVAADAVAVSASVAVALAVASSSS